MTPKKVAAFALGPILGAALGLIILPFLTWFFTAEDIGRFTMLQVIIGLSTSLFSLAMHQAYVREYYEVDDREVLFKAAILPSFAFLTVTLLLTLCLPYSISEVLFGIKSNFLVVLLLIGIYSKLVINFLAHVLRMQERGLAFSATQITPKLLLVLFISFILVFSIEARFQVLMLMNISALFGSLSLFAWLTRKTWVPALFKPLNKDLVKNLLSFSLPLVAGGLAYWGLTTIDRFFLRAYSSFEELGVYAVSVSLAAAVSVVSTIFSNLWHPTVYKWVREGVKPEKVQAVIENMLIAVAIIWSLVGTLSWVALYFLPSEYQAVEYLVVACVAMPLFYILSETTVVGIGIARRTSFSMFASIGAFITNIVLNYLLIPEYGASGAALATVASFFVFFTIRTEASAKLWCSLPRLKVYMLVIIYMTVTSTMVITEARITYFYLLWLGALALTFSMYFKRLLLSYSYLKGYLSKGN
ncbi:MULTISPECIES: oligosaccharide flippase family protein [unclassified Idiomarina]|uniref:lipopolysaccharide biosynthesis protein n=2 Tax=Idiomarina TaxID=135575 RepID=UPI00257D012D|nr:MULTISPECIES: oligosaccharide flippase family protein [unclassified Idiomarina]